MSKILFISGSGEDLGYVSRNFIKNTKGALDVTTDLNIKPVYLHNKNVMNTSYSEYSIQYPYADNGYEFKDLLKQTHIFVYDDFMDLYLFAQILKVNYVNAVVAEIVMGVLPIHTSLANDNKQIYDVLYVKSNIYSDTVPQEVIGDPVCYLDKAAAGINTIMNSYSQTSLFAMVVNVNLVTLGINNFSLNPVVSGGITILTNPLQPISSKWCGGSVGGMILFFTTQSDLHNFSNSLLNKEIYVRTKTEVSGTPVSGLDIAVKQNELLIDRNGVYTNGRVDRAQVSSYLTPINLTYDNILAVYEVPETMRNGAGLDTPLQYPGKLTLAKTPPKEKYALTPTKYQIKIYSPSGDVITLDTSNLLALKNVDGNEAEPNTDISYRIILSGGGQPNAELQIGDTAYTLKLYDFPKLSITGISSDVNPVKAYNRNMGGFSSVTENVETFFTKITNFAVRQHYAMQYYAAGNTERLSDTGYSQAAAQASINSSMFSLDKTTVLSGGGAANWKLLRCHVEIYYLSDSTRARLNSVYSRWGYTDYRQGELDINTYKGFVKVTSINFTKNQGEKFSYIDGEIFTGIADQLTKGVYFSDT